MTTTKTYGRGISRIDSKTTHGWYVRGYKNGKVYSKLFSDAKSGGYDHALDYAKTYRDSLVSRLDKIKSRRGRRRSLDDEKYCIKISVGKAKASSQVRVTIDDHGKRSSYLIDKVVMIPAW